jgi:hypothetical protein
MIIIIIAAIAMRTAVVDRMLVGVFRVDIRSENYLLLLSRYLKIVRARFFSHGEIAMESGSFEILQKKLF